MTTGSFPVPVAGELLYGLLARHRMLSGSRTAADHSTELFGRRSAVASFDLPCRLDALAARLPASTGLDGVSLLSHTLYPFYAAFQTEETREAVRHDLLASDASNAHHRLGVAAFRVRGGQALRFCPDCLDAQVDEVGVGTWLIAHQLPGVIVCPHHGCWLRDSLVTRATAGRHGYVSPGEANCLRDARAEDRSVIEAAHPLLRDLAEAACALTVACIAPRPLDDWRAHYVGRLDRVGLMRSPCKVDQAALNGGLRAHWGPVLRYLPAPCSAFGESGWAAAMVRSHRKAMHPIFHLMLDGFLSHLERSGAPFESDAAAVVREDRQDAAAPVVISARPRRTDWAAVDERLEKEVTMAALKIRSLSPPRRVSSAEIERRVAKADWFGKRRRKLPLAVRALTEARESVSEFQRRRAVHWIARLGPSCRAWEVMRAAGLRSAQLPMIRETMAASGVR